MANHTHTCQLTDIDKMSMTLFNNPVHFEIFLNHIIEAYHTFCPLSRLSLKGIILLAFHEAFIKFRMDESELKRCSQERFNKFLRYILKKNQAKLLKTEIKGMGESKKDLIERGAAVASRYMYAFFRSNRELTFLSDYS